MRKKMEMIFQQSTEDCGYAALVMLLKSLGINLSLQQIKMAYAKAGGLSLLDIRRIAKVYGVNVTVYFLNDPASMLPDKPCILHWRSCHYVLAYKKKKGMYQIYDPKKGISNLSGDHLNEYATGIVIEPISCDAKSGKLEKSEDWLQLRFVNNVKTLLLIIFMLMLSQALLFLSPFLLQMLVDKLTNQFSLQLPVWLVIVYILSKAAEVVFEYGKIFALSSYGRAFNMESAKELIAKLNRLPFYWYADTKAGELFNTIGSIYKLNAIFVDHIAVAIVDGMISLVMVVVLVYLVPLLFLIILISLLIEAFIYKNFIGKIKRLVDFSIRLKNECDHLLLENIKSILSIRVNLISSIRHLLWLDRFNQYGDNAFQISKFKSIYHIARSSVIHLETLLLVVLSAIMIRKGELSYGGFYMVLFYKNHIHESIKRMFEKYFDYQFVADHIRNVNYIMHEKDDDSILDSILFNAPENQIHAQNICFRYPKSDQLILNHFTQTFEMNKSYCIIGSSGSGKSTLLSLLMGVMRPTSGFFYVDDRQYPSLNHQSYQSIIASVIQNDALFSGTILENISLFDPSPDIGRVKEVCEIACIDQVIQRLPMGYYTYIDGSGCGMSGGQKQRILLSRALYKRPRILFLDEATSHLDPETERLINRNIAELMMTKIIAAHRLETIRYCDDIVDLDH